METRQMKDRHLAALAFALRQQAKRQAAGTTSAPRYEGYTPEMVGVAPQSVDAPSTGGGEGETIIDGAGRVRPDAVTSEGFWYEGRRGQMLIPWPSFSMWLKILRLADARDAVALRLQYIIHMAGEAGGHEASADYAAVLETMVRKWIDSGVRYDVSATLPLDIAIAYTLLRPLYLTYLEERIERAALKWRLQARLSEAKQWERYMFTRAPRAHEGGWVCTLLESDEIGPFVAEVVPAIQKYLEGRPIKKKLTLP